MAKIFHKFRRWLNYNPPGALSARGWRSFNVYFKEKAPIRYFLTHTAWDTVYLPIAIKFDNVVDWIRYRTVDRYHIVRTGLEPGYQSVNSVILHSSFNILKDYVELGLGRRMMYTSDGYVPSFSEKYIPFYDRIFKRRYVSHGMKYLDWAATLDDPSLPVSQRSDQQAIDAREIRELYLWWTKIRPARKLHDVPLYSDQGLGMLSSLDTDFDHSAPDYVESSRIHRLNDQLESEWESEDTGMLIRLVKIRDALWI